MKLLLLIAGLVVWALAPALAALPGVLLFADDVVARGTGFEIRQSQLDDAIIAFRANAAARQQVVNQPRAEVETAVLDKLIVIAVLNQRANTADRVAATNSADKIIAGLQEQSGHASAYEQQLKVAGVKPDKFRADVIERAVSENVLDRELKGQIQISTPQAQQFYETNRARFQVPETFHAAHVLFATFDPATRQQFSSERKLEKRALADKVLVRARAGEDFAALAKEFSDDPTTKNKGGEVRLARGQSAPEFERALASLGAGQIADVVVTGYGFHVAKLIERQPARILDFAEVEARIKDALVAGELDLRTPAYLEKVKREAGVQVLKAR